MGAESDFECEFSATDLEDSLVRLKGAHLPKYFRHYTEALEYIKEQCEKISVVEKVCTYCFCDTPGKPQPITNFQKNESGGRINWCNSCMSREVVRNQAQCKRDIP